MGFSSCLEDDWYALTGPACSPFVIDGLFAFVSRAFCFRSMSLYTLLLFNELDNESDARPAYRTRTRSARTPLRTNRKAAERARARTHPSSRPAEIYQRPSLYTHAHPPTQTHTHARAHTPTCAHDARTTIYIYYSLL